MNTNEITATSNGGGVKLSESIIPSTYSSSYSFSVLIDRDCTISPITRIPPITNMWYYSQFHIPNYFSITTYPNDTEYNPNTNGVSNFDHAFAELSNCRDTISSIMDRFDWNSCTDMNSVFYHCYNLTGDLTYLPSNAINMGWAFWSCRNITGNIPNIPNTVTDISSSFHDCPNLTGSIPVIPNNVINMHSTFYGCNKLTGPILNIGSNVVNMAYAFRGCNSISSSNIYIHSNKVTNAVQCFYGIRNNINVYIHFNTTTYNTFNSIYGSSSTISIKTF